MKAFRARSLLLIASLTLAGAGVPAVEGAEPHESVGWRPTAIPLINFSSDDGTGYGLRSNLFRYDGHTVPYRTKWSAQLFATTRGKWVHRVLMDTPRFAEGQRLEVELLYEKEEFANFFGDLPDSVLAAYTKDEKTFHQAEPSVRVMWIGDLGGTRRLRVGMQLAHRTIDPNAGGGSVLRALRPRGFRGGALAKLDVALRADTRDNYNDARAGALSQGLVTLGVGDGGRYRGVQGTLEHRRFIPLQGGVSLATRFIGDISVGRWPFYEELELGGSSTVRGLASARDRGEARLLLNAELRWRGATLWRGQHLRLGGVLFHDMGQIFDRTAGPDLGDWRRGAGAGLRLAWASTIVRADYARSGERTGLYITFGQLY